MLLKMARSSDNSRLTTGCQSMRLAALASRLSFNEEQSRAARKLARPSQTSTSPFSIESNTRKRKHASDGSESHDKLRARRSKRFETGSENFVRSEDNFDTGDNSDGQGPQVSTEKTGSLSQDVGLQGSPTRLGAIAGEHKSNENLSEMDDDRRANMEEFIVQSTFRSDESPHMGGSSQELQPSQLPTPPSTDHKQQTHTLLLTEYDLPTEIDPQTSSDHDSKPNHTERQSITEQQLTVDGEIMKTSSMQRSHTADDEKSPRAIQTRARTSKVRRTAYSRNLLEYQGSIAESLVGGNFTVEDSSVLPGRRLEHSANLDECTHSESNIDRARAIPTRRNQKSPKINDGCNSSTSKGKKCKSTTSKKKISGAGRVTFPKLRKKSLIVRLHFAKAKFPTAILSQATPSKVKLSETIPLEIPIDQKLAQIAARMTARLPLGQKLLPRGEPQVWADSRQALCETLPYFNRARGGCHQSEGHVYSLLFDGIGHIRDYMDQDIIIARASGGMGEDEDGNMVQKKDQDINNAQIKALKNDIEHRNPIIVICGDRNASAITAMPHKYSVLGWYKPVMFWAEKTKCRGNKSWKTVKYRFERLGNGESWHAPRDLPVITDEDNEYIGQPHARSCLCGKCEGVCLACNKTSPRIYLEGWMCLHDICPKFWNMACGQEPETLTYSPAFLLRRTRWDNEHEPFDVRPPIPDVGSAIGNHLTKLNTRGICCPLCGRCTQRYKFTEWVCDAPGCSFRYAPMQAAVALSALVSPLDAVGNGAPFTRNKCEAGVEVEVSNIYGYKVCRYTFEGIEGSLIHLAANKVINSTPGGPDAMLVALQTEEFGLERRRFASEKMSGPRADKKARTKASERETSLPTPPTDPEVPLAAEEEEEEAEISDATPMECERGDFMSAYAMNFGMAYKFIAVGASKPFANAPWPVKAARSLLNRAQKLLEPTLPADPNWRPPPQTEFNEELVVAYKEGQKMGYHDDGEKGLRRLIATLSIGGKAKMHLRMKQRYYTGCSKSGLFNAERPVPGGYGGELVDKRRRKAWEELEGMADKGKYRQRQKEIPRELGIYANRNRRADDMVVLNLNHGDIVIMDGGELQKYLEHKVIPEGHLRFALTCRTILPEHIKPEERSVFEPDTYEHVPALLIPQG